MAATILITLSLIIGTWLLFTLLYKYAVKQKNKYKVTWLKNWMLVLTGFIPTVASIWFIANMAGAVIIHTLSILSYNPQTEIDRLANRGALPESGFTNVFNKEEGYIYTTKDKNGIDLKYYRYTKGGQDYQSGDKIVIIHHGINGSRFRSWTFVNSLSQIPNMDRTHYISYDSVGWNDGKSRGLPTYGVNEADDLYLVLQDVIKQFQNPSEIVLYGFSMGGGTILNMIDKYKTELESDKMNVVDKYIIDSGYYDLEEELKFYALKFIASEPVVDIILDGTRWLYSIDTRTSLNFSVLDSVSTFDRNLMLIHSKSDSTVKFNFSEDIWNKRKENNLKGKTTVLFVNDAPHVDINNHNKEEFITNVGKFLANDNSSPFCEDKVAYLCK